MAQEQTTSMLAPIPDPEMTGIPNAKFTRAEEKELIFQAGTGPQTSGEGEKEERSLILRLQAAAHILATGAARSVHSNKRVLGKQEKARESKERENTRDETGLLGQ